MQKDNILKQGVKFLLFLYNCLTSIEKCGILFSKGDEKDISKVTKTNRIALRLADSDRTFLDKYALEHGIKLSEAVRQAIQALREKKC